MRILSGLLIYNTVFSAINVVAVIREAAGVAAP
jgi:hypothetical protein